MFSARCLCASCNGTLLAMNLAADYGTVCSPTKYFMISVLSKYEYVSKLEVGDTQEPPPVTELVGTV